MGERKKTFLFGASYWQSRYISLMWEISLDHHESVRSIIFSSIVHLSETLPLADVEFTYNLLKKLPLEKYDDQTLEFLSKQKKKKEKKRRKSKSNLIRYKRIVQHKCKRKVWKGGEAILWSGDLLVTVSRLRKGLFQ